MVNWNQIRLFLRKIIDLKTLFLFFLFKKSQVFLTGPPSSGDENFKKINSQLIKLKNKILV